jgi:general secretion pathway protein A
MFVEYFRFDKQPFGSTPDPSFLFQGDSHREALASLYCAYYANRGFTALIAEPGVGKTTLLFEFLDHIRARTVFLFNTLCDPSELLPLILRDLGITPSQSAADQYLQLNNVLITEARAGRRFVLVIDEAQNLSMRALEAVRLLTNFESTQAKLMQVVLAGQPRLADTLSRHEVTQLQQRISTICRLAPLTPTEVSAYIEHRLAVAGCSQRNLFTPTAIDLIVRESHGIPRIINTLCFNSLCLCRALNARQVNGEMVAEAISDLQLPVTDQPKSNREPIADATSAVPVESSRANRTSQTLSFAAMILLGLCVGLGMTRYANLTALRSIPIVTRDTGLTSEKVRPTDKPSGNNQQVQLPALENSTVQSQNSGSGQLNLMKVTVAPGDTLEAIVTNHLGSYNGSILQEVRALNPRITDPNHIETGRTLRLPAHSDAVTSPPDLRKEE